MPDDINLPGIVGTLAGLPEHVQAVVVEYGKACARAAVEADRAQQAAEIERLRKDAALLDWLDAKNARFRIGWRVGQAPIGNVNVHAIVQLGTGPLTSIRAAIDAAMKENDHG